MMRITESLISSISSGYRKTEGTELKKYIIFLWFAFLLIPSFAQESRPHLGPLNPEFLRYMEVMKKGILTKKTTQGFIGGYIPDPVIYKTGIPPHFVKTRILPEQYDLRTEGLLTSVKDQGSCGSCWTFSTMGALESRWLQMGLDPFDLSENNLLYGHGFECFPSGSRHMSTTYFVRGDGPISETDDPYQDCDGAYHSGLMPQAYIPDARFLPSTHPVTQKAQFDSHRFMLTNEVIKQMVFDYGGVAASMYWDWDFYNENDYTYYYSGSSDVGTNHGILIAGWDDHKVTSGGNGAWIVKNSWGTNFGEAGYFYISYNDNKTVQHPTVWPNRVPQNPNAVIYGYDRLGHLSNFGWEDDNTDYALVRFDLQAGQQILKVGTWVNTSNSTVRLDVYNDFDGDVLSGFMSSTLNQVCEYPGYYTYDLLNPIEVIDDNDIYIKVKYQTPDCVYCIPVEKMIEDYAYPEIELGKCWVSDTGREGSWIGLGTDDTPCDLCIKAYVLSNPSSSINDDKMIPAIPLTFKLYPNYPNPFNATTTIPFQLPRTAWVNISLYNMEGQWVETLVDKQFEAGYYRIPWDARRKDSGLYFYRILAGASSSMGKCLLIK